MLLAVSLLDLTLLYIVRGSKEKEELGQRRAKAGPRIGMPIGMRGQPLAPSRRVLFTTDVHYSPPERPRKALSSAPMMSRDKASCQPHSSTRRCNDAMAPSKFVRVLMPGSHHDGRAGIVLSQDDDVPWDMPVHESDEVTVMFDSLEMVPINRRCLAPATSVAGSLDRERRTHACHGVKDRSYTSRCGAVDFSSEHANPEAMKSGWRDFWKMMDAPPTCPSHPSSPSSTTFGSWDWPPCPRQARHSRAGTKGGRVRLPVWSPSSLTR